MPAAAACAQDRWAVRVCTKTGIANVRAKVLIDATGMVPVVNQIELHPRLAQTELRQLHAQLGIATEAATLRQNVGDRLKEMGVVIKDTPEGTVWRKES